MLCIVYFNANIAPLSPQDGCPETRESVWPCPQVISDWQIKMSTVLWKSPNHSDSQKAHEVNKHMLWCVAPSRPLVSSLPPPTFLVRVLWHGSAWTLALLLRQPCAGMPSLFACYFMVLSCGVSCYVVSSDEYSITEPHNIWKQGTYRNQYLLNKQKYQGSPRMRITSMSSDWRTLK